MLTHIVRHIFRMPRFTNFKLGIPMEDDEMHQPQAPWPPRSKVKVAISRDQSEPSWPNAVPVSLEAGGGIQWRPNPAVTLLFVIPPPGQTGRRRRFILWLSAYLNFFRSSVYVTKTCEHERCWKRLNRYWCNWYKYPKRQGHETINFGK